MSRNFDIVINVRGEEAELHYFDAKTGKEIDKMHSTTMMNIIKLLRQCAEWEHKNLVEQIGERKNGN